MDKTTIPSDCAYPMGDHAPGLTKREHIAASIFAAAIGRDRSADLPETARIAVKAADALIGALNE